MPVPVVVVTQFLFALIAYSLVAKWYVVPNLAGRAVRTILPPLILMHLIRPVSMWLLVPGVLVQPTMPVHFAQGTAYGDLLAASLALVAALMVRNEVKGALVMAWVFNVVGIFDALRNCLVGMLAQAPTHMGAMVFVPAYGVPLLLVSHVLIFKILLDQRRKHRAAVT